MKACTELQEIIRSSKNCCVIVCLHPENFDYNLAALRLAASFRKFKKESSQEE